MGAFRWVSVGQRRPVPPDHNTRAQLTESACATPGDPWGPTDAHRGVTRPLEENGEVVLIFFRVQSKFQTGHFIHKNFSLDRSNARTTL